MKRRWIVLYFLLLFLPYLALLIAGSFGSFKEKPNPQEKEDVAKEPVISLYRSQSKTIETLNLSDYLWGVLAGEMPASYPQEALKAQVVASYSYLLHRKQTISEHPNQEFGHAGDICDDPAHCKAYLSPKEAGIRYGKEWIENNTDHLKNAVDAVFGEALLFESQPINAVFHAISGGATEDAADVWGASIPYLQSVDSHWDERAKDFATTLKIPKASFQEIIGQTDCTLGAATFTKGGSIATQVIGGKSFTGRQLRSLFQLRSTRFTLDFSKDEAIFSVIGYGHQVGMSQYGASILAEEGYTYEEILIYYYSGTTLAKHYYPNFE